MPRLIWAFAGRTLILLVLSCCGSFQTEILKSCKGSSVEYWTAVTCIKQQRTGRGSAVLPLQFIFYFILSYFTCCEYSHSSFSSFSTSTSSTSSSGYMYIHFIFGLAFVVSDMKGQPAASDQGLYCLLTEISIRNRMKMKKYTIQP